MDRDNRPIIITGIVAFAVLIACFIGGCSYTLVAEFEHDEKMASLGYEYIGRGGAWIKR